MVTLSDLKSAPSLAKKTRYRLALEILSGRKPGKVHNRDTIKTLQLHGMVDQHEKITILGLTALDN